ncbi:hypothetical protein ACFQJ5_11225 [Halomicroarcula sp. GCM10025324]|uniref:DUF7547 family protein n=1 Tax=Haloarcula TaxID=2237 RepID=UPI0023E7CC0D|nr:hypothetical protein [Halomicroarcula sp. ZS-22-S1]
MSDSSGDDVTALLTDLVTTLRDLETAVEPRTERGRPRPPTPKELLRFTSDVTIPAAILVLRTNIEALKLLRRAIRLAERRPVAEDSTGDAVRARAAELSSVTLRRLDGALTEIQRAVEGTPEDEDARELLEEARALRADLADRLQEVDEGRSADGTDDSLSSVSVDVDAELQSIKDDIDPPADDESTNTDDES